MASSVSALLSSICINQASSSTLLEEEEDMMPGLENSGGKKLKMKTRDIVVVWWSKPSRDYIMNFYRPKGVLHKKMESIGHTRWEQAIGVRLGGRTRPPGLSPPRALFRLLLIFLIFKYSKTKKNCHWKCFGVGLLTVPHTYSFSESETS